MWISFLYGAIGTLTVGLLYVILKENGKEESDAFVIEQSTHDDQIKTLYHRLDVLNNEGRLLNYIEKDYRTIMVKYGHGRYILNVNGRDIALLTQIKQGVNTGVSGYYGHYEDLDFKYLPTASVSDVRSVSQLEQYSEVFLSLINKGMIKMEVNNE